jgi:hypothetical protein
MLVEVNYESPNARSTLSRTQNLSEGQNKVFTIAPFNPKGILAQSPALRVRELRRVTS